MNAVNRRSGSSWLSHLIKKTKPTQDKSLHKAKAKIKTKPLPSRFFSSPFASGAVLQARVCLFLLSRPPGACDRTRLAVPPCRRVATLNSWCTPCAPLSYGCAGGFRFQRITPRCCFEKPSQTKQTMKRKEMIAISFPHHIGGQTTPPCYPRLRVHFSVVLRE